MSKHLADCRKPYPRSREFLTKLANRPAKSLADTISSDALPIVAELRTPPPIVSDAAARISPMSTLQRVGA